MRKALLITGYALAFLAALVIGLLLGVPDERIRVFAEHQINAHSPNLRVTMADLSVSGFGGVSLEGLSLTHAVKKSKLVIPRIDVDVHPFRWLAQGRVAVDLDAKFPAGELKGASYREDDGGWHLKLGELAQVGVGPLLGFFRAADDKEQPLEKRFPVSLRGALSGEVDLGGAKQLRTVQDLLDGRGTVHLTLTDAMLDRLILSMKDQWGNPQAFELRNIRLGTVTLEIVADRASAFADLKRLPKNQAVIVFKKIEIDGPDLEVITDGLPYVKVRKGKFDLSDLNASLLLKIKPSLFTRPAKGPDGKKETPNSWLKTVLEMDKRAKAALSQGYYGVRLAGMVTKPSPTLYRPLIRGELKDAIDKKAATDKEAAAKAKEAAAKKAAEARKAPAKSATPAVDSTSGAPAASGSAVGEPVRGGRPLPVETRPSEALQQKIDFKGATPQPHQFNGAVVPPSEPSEEPAVDEAPAAEEEPAADEEQPVEKTSKRKKKAASDDEASGDEEGGEEGGDEGGEEGGEEGGDEGGEEGGEEGGDEGQE